MQTANPQSDSHARLRAAFLQYATESKSALSEEKEVQRESEAQQALDEVERQLALLPAAKQKELEGLLKTARNLPVHMIQSEAARLSQTVNSELQKTGLQAAGAAAMAAGGGCVLCCNPAPQNVVSGLPDSLRRQVSGMERALPSYGGC